VRQCEGGAGADREDDTEGREAHELLLSSGWHTGTLSGQRDERADGEGGSEDPDPGRGAAEPAHAVYTLPSRTTTDTGGSGRLAGPCTTAPVLALNALP
jgi:hypothetical protein